MRDAIHHGDAFHVLGTLPAGCVQCCFVDPPYNFGIDYGSGAKDDLLEPGQYLQRMETLARLCVQTLSPSGCLWFLVPERWADDIGCMLTSLLPRRNRIIWRETFGQYLESRFPPGHRHLFWHVNDAAPFYTDDIRIVSQRMIDGDKRAAGPRVPDDVWQFPRLVGNAGERIGKHPCQLPERLLERVIRCASQPGDVILDPMAGTGTTLRVAQRLGRRYIGIEQQPKYVELIRKRLAASFQQPLFS
jgi:site-specific DNA-methyltransferase (adenine-specific)